VGLGPQFCPRKLSFCKEENTRTETGGGKRKKIRCSFEEWASIGWQCRVFLPYTQSVVGYEMDGIGKRKRIVWFVHMDERKVSCAGGICFGMGVAAYPCIRFVVEVGSNLECLARMCNSTGVVIDVCVGGVFGGLVSLGFER